MSRKRTPKQPSADTETQAATPAATAIVEPPASESPGQFQTASDLQSTDIPEQRQSFAERVGPKKQWAAAPDPFGIASDNLAGVRLFESKQDRQMAIKFGEGRPEDKPSQAVIDKMKEAGFRWNPADRIWAHPIRAEFAMSTRIDAERLYQEVRQMIRQERGIESGQEVTF